MWLATKWLMQSDWFDVPVMVRHLGEQGLQAEAFETEYGDEQDPPEGTPA